MSQHTNIGHVYLNVPFKGELHEVGVSYLWWLNTSKESDSPVFEFDIYDIQRDVEVCDAAINQALVKYLKTQEC